jgi:hypothetical protein
LEEADIEEEIEVAKASDTEKQAALARVDANRGTTQPAASGSTAASSPLVELQEAQYTHEELFAHIKALETRNAKLELEKTLLGNTNSGNNNSAVNASNCIVPNKTASG